ncbi:4-Cys prefix domain-containing protein [Okeania sp. SIO2B3]|uniref:4-Cys prefix domain-containing protein n=1 Tax=Okeania sp. SIO2B3 TaxID=2607784 RepID=UPI0013BEB7A8|nr:4-Cys prefix domain-containing protein [Okeania sp. SIO2B3]NET43686.1 hypothetical protein [Okeania sp. SIO2B3]
MSYCLNPNCTKPNQQNSISFCINCGTKLLLKERYRPIKFLGAGGMGRNFLAIDEDTPLKRKCLIKQFFPAPNIANSQAAFQKAVELFNREAEYLDKLNVTAKDKGSGKEASITINNDWILSEKSIEEERPFLLSNTD